MVPGAEVSEGQKNNNQVSKLERLNQRIALLDRKKNRLEKEVKEVARRERTKRLIQIVALSEKYFGCTGVTPEKYEELLKRIVEIMKKSNHS